MALSGTFQNLVGSNGKFGIVCYWTGTQSIPNNQTTISITVKLRYWDVEIGSRTGSYNIGGSTGSWSASSIYDYDHQYWHETTLGTASAVITHNADGTATGKTLSITYPYRGYYGGVYFDSITASTSVDLDQIPRYATVTESLSSRTETSLTVAWATDSTADKLWYSTNSGSSYTEVTIAEGTSGSYTVTGLTAGTTYQVITKVRRKDSQLESESTAGSFATYAYPYATSMPNFTLGNSVTIGIFNPLGRSVTVKMLKGTTEIGSYTTSGTSVAGFNTTAMVNALYATIPSAKSAQYKISVIYGTNTTTNDGGTFTVKESDCKPTITGLTYQDTNATAVAITGNNQDIVRNISTVRYTATGLAGTKSATIASVQVYVNGNSYTLTRSGSTATGGNATINSGTNVTATATVTDSRGITNTKTVTVTMLDWSVPSAILNIARQNNYYTETDFKVDAQYAYINGHNTITITYRCVREDGGGSAVTGSLQDNVTKVVNLDNTYAWNITITLTDGFGGSSTYTMRLSRGMPIVYFDRLKNSVGINCFPQDEFSVEVPDGNLKNLFTFSTTETDFNNLTTGRFYYGNCSNFTHAPVASGDFILEVIVSGSDYLRQECMIKNSRGTDLYVRYRAGTVWGDWYAPWQTMTTSAQGRSALVDLIYPVGAIYLSTVNTSPATLFGGSWTQIKDTFLLTAGDTYTAGNTGGEATHTLSEAELPSISGSLTFRRWDWGSGTSSWSNLTTGNDGKFVRTQVDSSGVDALAYAGRARGSDKYTFSFGSGSAHNNLPPYLVVYAWRRTA